MHLEEISQRIEELQDALVIDTELKKTIFTPGERICINQEIASLLDRRKYLFSEKKLKEVFVYNVPESIENKLKKLK
ncbi:hypothetical protein [Flavobacterium sp. N2820]|uniref:hypothetical protein n=1 Tax=Flavobacterium sp. N2820 TaxID=2986834 RepID=UPI00222405A2|nr:hypothetical protein [Flavobacterium sp. N2820]